jgi:hypothetical protein
MVFDMVMVVMADTMHLLKPHQSLPQLLPLPFQVSDSIP